MSNEPSNSFGTGLGILDHQGGGGGLTQFQL